MNIDSTSPVVLHITVESEFIQAKFELKREIWGLDIVSQNVL